MDQDAPPPSAPPPPAPDRPAPSADPVARQKAPPDQSPSPETYRYMVEFCPDPVVILQDGRYAFANPAFCEVFAYAPRDLAGGLSFLELVQDKDKPAVRQRYQDRLAGKPVPRTFRLDLLARDGRQIPCETSASRIEYGGRPADLVILHDISERVRAREQLHQAEDRYRTLLESSSDEIVEMDAELHVTFVNDAVLRRSGRSREQWLGGSAAEMACDEDKARVERKLRQALAGQPVDPFEFRPAGPAEPRIHLELSVSPLTEGARVTGLLAASRDVSRRKRAESETQTARNYLETLIATSNDAILVIDAEGTLEFGNQMFFRVIGRPGEEVIGKHFLAMVPPDLHEDILQRWQEARAGRGEPYEVDVTTQSGQRRCLAVSYRHMTIAGERKYCVVVKDISERKQSEKQLAEYRDHLEDQVASRTAELRDVVEALRQSEARHRALVEQIPAIVYTASLEAEATTLYLSPQVESLLGHPVQDMDRAHRVWLDALHPEDRDRALAETRRLRETGDPLSTEYRMIGADGEVLWFRDMARIVHDDAGKPLAVQGVMFDITERKQAEENLRRSQRHLAAAEAIAHLGSWEYDPVRDVGVWSHEMCRIAGLGGDKAEVSFEGFLARVHPDDRELVRRTRKDSFAGRETGLMEYRMVRPDGTVRTLQTDARLHRDGEGNVVHVTGTAQDVTDRKRAEEDLRESERRYRAVFEAPQVGILVADAQTKEFVLANRTICTMLGYTQSQLLGMSVRDIHPPQAVEAIVQTFEAQVVGRIRGASGIPCLRSDGTVFYANITDTKVTLADRQCLVGFFVDVTARVDAERRLRAARRKIGAAREDSRRRIARELHDSVNQGLIALQLRLHTLSRQASAGGPLSDRDVLRAAARHCTQLVDELRRISHGLYPPALEQLGLPAALEQLAADTSAPPTKVTFECDRTLRDARLGAEAEIALFRVAQEAVSNALRHAGAGRVEISLAPRGGQVVLQVTDDGVGFDVDTVTRGLGLTSMRDRMGALDGELTISSEPGGTCVRAGIPADPGAGQGG